MRKGVVREGMEEKLQCVVLKDICMPSSSSPLKGVTRSADWDSSEEEAEIVESEGGQRQEQEEEAESTDQDYRPFLF